MKKVSCLLLLSVMLAPMVSGVKAEIPSIVDQKFYSMDGNEIGWHLEQINIAGAWELTQGSEDIVIAIIDSGIDFSHPELTNAQWLNLYEIPDNGVDDDIKYAVEQNVAVVAVTGNGKLAFGGGQQVKKYPGAYKQVIAVGATNYYGERADYSHYGKWTELVAPVGDGNCDVSEHKIQSLSFHGEYQRGWGTSYAGPQVAGVIALMKSINEDLTVEEARDILQKTAIDLGEPGKDNHFGYGLVNATAAVLETQRRLLYPTTQLSSGFTVGLVSISLCVVAGITSKVVRKRRKKSSQRNY